MTIIEATVTAATGMAVGGLSIVLGQADVVTVPANAPAWLTAAGSVVGPGFTMWYAWYVTVRIIPGMMREFREESREQRQQHAADMERLVASYREARQ